MLKQYHQTITALGGDVTLVVTSEHPFSEQDFSNIWRKVYEFERRFSRFLPESELSQFNRKAGLDVPISPEFATLLQASLQLSQQTDGLYNPFVLPAVQRAGYLRSAVAEYSDDTVPDYRARSVTDVASLHLRGDIATIPYGTAIDIGGCGKGYLADMIAADLRALALPGFWLSLSGDMVTYGVDASNQPWQTSVQAANLRRDVEQAISAAGNLIGIATSGTLRRPGQKLKSGKHHIIDPRTAQSADTDILLVTVVAEKAVEADVLASCAVILGSRDAPAFLRKAGVLASVIQTYDGIVFDGDDYIVPAQSVKEMAR